MRNPVTAVLICLMIIISGRLTALPSLEEKVEAAPGAGRILKI